MNSTVSKIVLDKILSELEKGVVPWKRPWIAVPKQNIVTKKPYQGINRLLLAYDNEEFYLSFKQIYDLAVR